MSKPLLPPEYELRMVTCLGDTEPTLWLIHMGDLSEAGVPEEELVRRAWAQFRREMSNERLHKLIEKAGGWRAWERDPEQGVEVAAPLCRGCQQELPG